ncbi:glycoside hydrolase superfamily [Aspergillus crustosus]
MHSLLPLLLPLLLSTLPTLTPALPNHTPNTNTKPFNWATSTPLGVNLGGWLVQEPTLDTPFWSTHAPSANTSDEWTFCALLGPKKCSTVLEHRYATFITESDIDSLADVGVELLRIPSTYAAWIDLPGSELYSGSQQRHLRRITEYAIQNYDMHVILDIHSLPGGLNGLTIGEATGRWGWFYNETAWNNSLDVIDAVLEFIADSSDPGSFTLEPMNEPADRNRESDLGMGKFGTPEILSERAASYVLSFWKEVVERVAGFSTGIGRPGKKGIPVMLQSFKLPEYWSGNFSTDANVVFDMHNYYFEGRETTSENLPGFMRSDAQGKSGDGRFPVFVGEWSIQTAYNNTFELRERNLRAGLDTWKEFGMGSAYWTARFEGNTTVDGQGSQKDYWSFERFIEMGFLG